MELEVLVNKYKKEFKNNTELKVRRIKALNNNFALIYLDSFSDFDVISKDIILPLMKCDKKPENLIIESKISSEQILNFIIENVLYASDTTITSSFKDNVLKISRGQKLLLLENEDKGILIDTKKVEKRAVVEPPTNNIVKGPREGFIEDLKTNLNLIRKRLPTTDLKIEELEIGKYTKTKVAICSLTSIADKKVIKKIKERLSEIKIDGIIDSYYLQDFLEEKPSSIFKQVGYCEKPDILVAKMLEGRVGIIVDGSPIVLTLPFLLIEDLQNSEDYYENGNKVSFIRMLRLFGLIVALITPGLYIALQLYHLRALPLKFLTTIMNSSQNIPMPPALEVLFAFFMFEILYEASIRTPKGLGSSFNIIGALILGDTAVKSNLSSAPTIMIVALSSIALYLLPETTSVLRLIRLGLTLLGAMLGLLGMVIGIFFIVTYLNDFDSYGAAYLSPISPYIFNDWKDFIIKSNITKMKTRPLGFKQKNLKRMGENDAKGEE